MSKKQPDWMRPFGSKWGGRVRPGVVISPVVSGPTPRAESTGPIKAKFTPHGGTARDKPTYTGTAMLGIGTMHKSNAVPVFSADEATDLAKMRRG